MNVAQITRFADHLAEAEKSGIGVAPITTIEPDITTEQAYHIQLQTIERKVKAGDVIVGRKIGLTSLAMQKLLGVDQPDYGHLLASMAVENHGEISFKHVLQPKVEAEFAFFLKRDLVGPNITTLDVLMATEYVVPALEIVDSRIANWKIKLQDTIADNASSGFYVLGGRPVKPDQIDLAMAGMALYKNGELMNTGVGAAALGHPASCVAWLANKLAEFELPLRAGEVILSGALSAAIEASPGDTFRTKIAHLGEVGVRFTS